MPEDNKLYEVELTYAAENATTGVVHITKEQYNFLSWVTNYRNWENLNYESYCGSLIVWCDELEDQNGPDSSRESVE